MGRNGLLMASIVGVLFSLRMANAQCETAGECFCDTQGAVGIAQLIRGVNIALGQSDCPSIAETACSCCACDFGAGDVECGTGDTDCVDCQLLGGAPAADCSVCSGSCSGAETLCNDNPQHCHVAPHCQCCACDFGAGDLECGAGDIDCSECTQLGGTPAAECAVCGEACTVAQTLCLNDPGACKLSQPAPARSRPHYSPPSAATRAHKRVYGR
jgi:hypothetical protein